MTSESIHLQLRSNFGEVLQPCPDLFLVKDELPAKTFRYYVGRLSDEHVGVCVCENIDDKSSIVTELFEAATSMLPNVEIDRLQVLPFATQRFHRMLVVPPAWHRQLSGRLGSINNCLYQIQPVFEYEYSEDLSLGEFQAISRRRSLSDWNRPDVVIAWASFHNPRTMSGTTDDAEVILDLDYIMFELEELNGVSGGYLTIRPIQERRTTKITSPAEESYQFESLGNTRLVEHGVLRDHIDAMIRRKGTEP